MSGFAGIANLDGAPADEVVLGAMAAAITARGPDATAVWRAGEAGLAFTLLRTAADTSGSQPFSLDDRVWIVGDVRVDARRELTEALPPHPAGDVAGASDIELILRAYLAWGERCVDRLLGDFAFAIWDGPRRRLFAARDHMGVKPFYYAHVGATVIISNTLASIRRHPQVSHRLDEGAVADFLLFDVNQDPSATIFADIRRLPPAHTLTAGVAGVAAARYWTMPVDEPLHYRRMHDYTDAFDALLHTAVDDRLRGDRVGVFMSGGIDSPTLAAVAHGIAGGRADDAVRAFSWVEDRNDGGAERRYATLAARHIGIPIDIHEPDLAPIDWTWEQQPATTAEPDSGSWRAAARIAYHRRAAALVRVFLFGEGPDNALYYEWRPYLRFLASTGRYGAIGVAAARHLVTQQRVPLWNHLFRSARDAGSAAGAPPPQPQPPLWLADDLARRADIDERRRRLETAERAVHPVRPQAYASLSSPLWQVLFETCDADRMGAPLEVRHPFVDIRLLRFMLAVPAIPWCRRKYLLRRAMRGRLPAAVLRREKGSIPTTAISGVKQRLVSDTFTEAPQLADYVDVGRLRAAPPIGAAAVDAHLRVRALNHWLHQLGRRVDLDGR